jgi:prepilin-type processing-associated H-X9-DG protein
MNRCAGLLCVSLMLPAAASAEAPADANAKAWANEIAPFVDGQTLLVARIDVAAIDVDAVLKWWADMAVAAVPPEARAEQKQAVDKSIEEFRKEPVAALEKFRSAGGRVLYVVLDPADFPPFAPPPLIVPLTPGADERALAGLLCSGDPAGPTSRPLGTSETGPKMISERIGNAMVFASDTALARLRTIKPAARPELAEAFAAGGNAVLQIAVIPSEDARRVIDAMLATLPPELGGGPSTALTKGVRWAVLSVSPPPKAAWRLCIQSDDAESAKALHNVIASMLDTVVKAKESGLPFDPEAIQALLLPHVTGDRLTLALDSAGFDKVITQLLLPSLMRARELAKRTVSAANEKGIVLACIVYASEHQNQWPPDLDVLVKNGSLSPKSLVNPRFHQYEIGYVYLRPGVSMRDIHPMQVVLYEKHEGWPEGINLGFADGHVEFMTDQAYVTALIEASKNNDAEAIKKAMREHSKWSP